MGLYSTDGDVIAYGLIRMLHALLFNGMTGVYEVSGGALRGMGYSMAPAALTVLGCCGFRLFWVFTVFEHFKSFEMLMNVYPASWLLTNILVMTAYFIISRKKSKDFA